MADPTAGGGTEGLREALARIIDSKALEIMGRSVVARHERWAVLGESIAYRKADALIAGPIADFLARASTEQARVEAERDEREAWAAAWHRVVDPTPPAVLNRVGRGGGSGGYDV